MSQKELSDIYRINHFRCTFGGNVHTIRIYVGCYMNLFTNTYIHTDTLIYILGVFVFNVKYCLWNVVQPANDKNEIVCKGL